MPPKIPSFPKLDAQGIEMEEIKSHTAKLLEMISGDIILPGSVRYLQAYRKDK